MSSGNELIEAFRRLFKRACDAQITLALELTVLPADCAYFQIGQFWIFWWGGDEPPPTPEQLDKLRIKQHTMRPIEEVLGIIGHKSVVVRCGGRGF
ncbi:MAG: hypothetical protein ACD_43C00153G0003 [uncultured bacterium]|nr:MAG: hypothetical protein ACD_43C00153G0003 [uncultured bacterium]